MAAEYLIPSRSLCAVRSKSGLDRVLKFELRPNECFSNLYRLGKEVHTQKYFEKHEPEYLEEFKRSVPDPLHIWIVGNHDWLSRVTPDEPLRTLVGNETDPSYRIAIIGADLANIQDMYLGDWGSWFWQAGMTHKRKHRNRSEYRASADPLLNLMLRHYGSGSPPPDALDALNAPTTYFGDYLVQ